MSHFFRKILGEEQKESEESHQIEGEEEAPGGLTVEHAAEIIKDLPQEVSRESALRIVKQTLRAAGIEIGQLENSTRMREARLTSEIELGQRRVEELQKDATEKVRQLREEVRRIREDRDFWVAEEERRVSEARGGLEDVELVREFFEFPDQEEQEPEQRQEAVPEDSTRVIRSGEESAEENTHVMRRGPLSEEGEEER